MDDIYKEVLYVQEVCINIVVAAKTINSDIKKFYHKDDIEAVYQMRIALDSLQASTGNLDTIISSIEKGE